MTGTPALDRAERDKSMQPKSPMNAVAVKKEEKEAKLRAFVAGYLASDAVIGIAASERTLLLVARSCDSPVVATLRGMQSELTQHGFTVCLILAAELDDRRLAPLSAALGWDVRCLNDIRYLDAHEQLVLGPMTAWIGDCMRRDPSKRDAFENFASGCAATSSHALKSFRRMWQAAVPVASAPRSMPAATPAPAECAAAALVDQAAEQVDAPSALTRQ